jgi:quinol monooxygenase YgiN
MAYIYQVGFDIRPDQMTELEIGSSLERVLGYLRTLLPTEPGFITAQAMYSLDTPERVHLVFESIWEDWDLLHAHLESGLAEHKVLQEFEPHVTLQGLTSHVYAEVP